ncbi:hypothetical protein [Oceanihabitans sediminis]|uniref:hypothetical protein n=1 Tax=Oceanihabitans sediminis TaxID=1812012 RepID=UPI003A94AA3D
MKNFQFKMQTLLYMSITCIVLISCSSDDDSLGPIADEPDPTVEPLVLDCSIITEAMVLEDRGSGIDYIWPCEVKVRAPLTIEPGVTIAFEQGGGLIIDDYDTRTGALIANGTTSKPIVFTGTNQTPGAWNRIYMDSGDINNILNHCIIEFAGGTNGSLPALSNVNGSKVEVKNTIIRKNKGDGVFVTTSANIDGWQANMIIENQGFPMQIAARKVKFLDGEQTTYADNGNNQIYVNSGSIYNRGYIEDEVDGPVHTWLNPGIPIFIEENIYVRQDRVNERPGHLKIMDGCNIIFAEDYGIQMIHNNTVLEVLGTQENPVNFSGLNGQGSWKGINITQSVSSLNKIENTIISDAGQSHWNWFNQNGGLSLGDQTSQSITLTLNNVQISNSGGCGIVERKIAANSSLNYTNLTFTNNIGNDICEEL